MLSGSNLFFCMTASNSHQFAHGDVPYKTEILRYGLGTLNQLVAFVCELASLQYKLVRCCSTVHVYQYLPIVRAASLLSVLVLLL